MATLSASALLVKARERSGIDINDTEAIEPMGILVDSLNAEAQLNSSGLVAMEQRLLRILINRLRMERDYAAHPEIADEKIVAPIFVFGLPRTGTTKMQKLLSVAGDFTALPLWMAHNPSLIGGDRGEKPDRRIAETREYTEWIDRVSPGVRAVHAFDADGPEEVNPIMEQGFLSAYLPAFVEVPSYIHWYAMQDPRKQLRYVKRVIQYLQWQFAIGDQKPWILKNPTFIGIEPQIREIFPDAKLVMTHRHPAAIIASSASLIVNFHKLYSDIDVTSTAGLMMAERQAWLMHQHLKNRDGMPELGIIDVGYSELMQDALGVVERVYGDVDYVLSEQARQNVRHWEANHQQHKYGSHRYSLSEYGLSETSIASQFSDYISRFDKLF